MNIRDTEMKILEILWESGSMPAKQLYKILEQNIGWKKSTTYTVLQKCIDKEFIRRIEPEFICEAIIKKSEVQEAKLSDLLKSYYDDSKCNFLNAFIKEESFSDEEIEELRKLVQRLK